MLESNGLLATLNSTQSPATCELVGLELYVPSPSEHHISEYTDTGQSKNARKRLCILYHKYKKNYEKAERFCIANLWSLEHGALDLLGDLYRDMKAHGQYKPASWKQVVLNITDKAIKNVTGKEVNVAYGLVAAYNDPRNGYHYPLIYAGNLFKENSERFKQIFGVEDYQELINSTPLSKEKKEEILHEIEGQMKWEGKQ